jgi:hypothetical protein
MLVLGGTGSGAPEEAPATASIPTDDLSLAAVEGWSGLDIPEAAEGFLTARAGADQLDLTFTMAPEDEQAFVRSSALPEPLPGRRYVLHSSPLWKLNPGSDDAPDTPDDSPTDTEVGPTVPAPVIRGTADSRAGITRVVELVDEAPGVVRARVVLTVSA